MKAVPIIIGVTVLVVSTLHAQIVNDGATNTLSNVTHISDGIGLFQFTDTNAPSFPTQFFRAVSP